MAVTVFKFKNFQRSVRNVGTIDEKCRLQDDDTFVNEYNYGSYKHTYDMKTFGF